jgi:hypothetical protein
MRTEAELNENILKITLTIRNEFPELLNFLNEIPITIPNVNNPKINNKILTDYFNSLENLFRKYATIHGVFINNL